MRRMESVWMNFLRRMVKGGFRRQHTYDERGEVEEENWAYKYTNNNIMRITNAAPISEFCNKQHLQYIAHVVRSDNDCLTKRLLFATATRKYHHDE